MVSTVSPHSGLHASDVIATAVKAIKGGSGRNAELAMAGGKDPSGLDEALGLARGALGLAGADGAAAGGAGADGAAAGHAGGGVEG